MIAIGNRIESIPFHSDFALASVLALKIVEVLICLFGVMTAKAGIQKAMNNPAASCGVSELGDEISLEGVTPECFYRGSSSEPAWIPA